MICSITNYCIDLIMFLSLFAFFFLGISPCNITISLLWSADKNTVTFVCKVNNLFWKMKFYSPSKQEVAHCLIPFPKSECYSLYGYYIKQERSTNTTILKVKRRLDTASEVNGLWRCTHGTNRGGAVVNVSVQNNGIYYILKLLIEHLSFLSFGLEKGRCFRGYINDNVNNKIHIRVERW